MKFVNLTFVASKFVNRLKPLLVLCFLRVAIFIAVAKEVEEKTGNDWSEIVEPKDGDLQSLTMMLADLRARNIEIFLYVNNLSTIISRDRHRGRLPG